MYNNNNSNNDNNYNNNDNNNTHARKVQLRSYKISTAEYTLRGSIFSVNTLYFEFKPSVWYQLEIS